MNTSELMNCENNRMSTGPLGENEKQYGEAITFPPANSDHPSQHAILVSNGKLLEWDANNEEWVFSDDEITLSAWLRGE